jgi:hypothetical protein
MLVNAITHLFPKPAIHADHDPHTLAVQLQALVQTSGARQFPIALSRLGHSDAEQFIRGT